jgi:hypothetical protein
MVAAGGERGQHGADMVVEEEHRRDDDVAAGDIGVAGRERAVVRAPLIGGMDDELQLGQIPLQGGDGIGHRPREVAVHGDDHHADGRGANGRSGLLHHTTSRS